MDRVILRLDVRVGVAQETGSKGAGGGQGQQSDAKDGEEFLGVVGNRLAHLHRHLLLSAGAIRECLEGGEGTHHGHHRERRQA